MEFGIFCFFFFVSGHGIGLRTREWLREWLILITRKVTGSGGIGLWARTGFCA